MDVEIINAVSITERPGHDVTVVLIFQGSTYLQVTTNITSDLRIYLFMWPAEVRPSLRHSVLPWPGPVKPDAVRRIPLPRIEFFKESFTPVERFVERVVRGTIDELD
jgi:hypothetical protein